MPYVHIRITREGTTADQKAQLIAGATDLMVRVLNKDPQTTHVVIEEVDLDNWGVGGLPVPEFREAREMNESIDRAAIESLMRDYFDGLYLSDIERLRRVFHPQAGYFTASGGSLVHYDMEQYFQIVDARPSPASKSEARSDRMLSIEFAGPVTAWVKAECAVHPRYFIDLLTVIKVDDQWRIIAKVFHYDIRSQPSHTEPQFTSG